MKKRFLHLGWKSKVSQKRATFSISINKIVAVGCNLFKGKELFCYLAEDIKKRPLMMVYLDGKSK
ncbi:MAG: hypothetical protein AABX85_01240 [Nanoarchaeota archaeon]